MVGGAPEAGVAGALEGANDIDTLAMGTQAVTQGALVDICGGSTWPAATQCAQTGRRAQRVARVPLHYRGDTQTHVHNDVLTQ